MMSEGNLNNTFRLVRKIVFGVAIAFSLGVLVVGALITNFTSSFYYGGYFTFAALGIATAVLTLLTLPVMLFLSLTRKGAVTSMIALELGWTWFLWIMWLSTGGSAASISWLGDCGAFLSDAESACRETQALTAFSFLTWFGLLAYNVLLFALVIRQHMRGNTGVWNSFITEADFTAAGPTSNMVLQDKMNVPQQNFAPQYVQPTAAPAGYVPPQVVTPPQMTTSYHPQV